MPAYSFQSVHCAIVGPGGAFQLGGQGAGNAEEGITITKDEKNTRTMGAEGSVMHSLHASEGGKITVRLLKTSPIHLQLTAMYQFQRTQSSNWGQNTIVLTDIERGDVYTMTQCAFSKFPDNVYARDGNVIDWEFDVGFVEPLLGIGTPDISQGI